MTYIIKETQGHLLRLILNRPDKFNSFNREMSLQLQHELDLAEKDTNVRSILITGQGKAFCAGQDLGEAIDPSGPGIKTIVEEHYNPIIQRIRKIEKPIVCAVNGVAAGAGANIALACDVVIASEEANFIQAFSKIALVPDSGGTFFLPRLIGLGKASALMMLGEKIGAKAAENMGMIYRVCSGEDLMAESIKLAEQLACMPTKALGLTKNLLNQSTNNSLEQQLSEEAAAQVIAASSEDYKEGVNAFLQKRSANFKGF